MYETNIQFLMEIIDFLIKTLALIIGGVWVLIKFKEYREFKNWIQLDVDANIFRLSKPEIAETISWDKEGNPIQSQKQNHTHAVEVLLTFKNKGKTRIKIYNIQIGINTMRPVNEARFDEEDGHLRLNRIHTSGNIVPKQFVKRKNVNKTSFYYIEPEVEQTISHLCLISEPRELIQVVAYFSLEHERIFPKKMHKPGGLFPHTAARTFQLSLKLTQ